jgi:hypothetical protein
MASEGPGRVSGPGGAGQAWVTRGASTLLPTTVAAAGTHCCCPCCPQVLEWTGQDGAYRELVKHRGKAWAQLPHGAKKALLAAADQLDWSFLGDMAAVSWRGCFESEFEFESCYNRWEGRAQVVTGCVWQRCSSGSAGSKWTVSTCLPSHILVSHALSLPATPTPTPPPPQQKKDGRHGCGQHQPVADHGAPSHAVL